MLDREVEEMVARASPLPPIPAELGIGRLELTLPVEFRIR